MKQSLPLAHISTSRLHACCVYINEKVHSDRHKHSDRAVALSMASEQFGMCESGCTHVEYQHNRVDRAITTE